MMKFQEYERRIGRALAGRVRIYEGDEGASWQLRSSGHVLAKGEAWDAKDAHDRLQRRSMATVRVFCTEVRLVDPERNHSKLYLVAESGEWGLTAWGRIGTTLQCQVVSADVAARKLDEKLAKGYEYYRSWEVAVMPQDLAADGRVILDRLVSMASRRSKVSVSPWFGHDCPMCDTWWSMDQAECPGCGVAFSELAPGDQEQMRRDMQAPVVAGRRQARVRSGSR
jgi:predicted DNA-binding WGR domain protein